MLTSISSPDQSAMNGCAAAMVKSCATSISGLSRCVRGVEDEGVSIGKLHEGGGAFVAVRVSCDQEGFA